VLTLLFAADSVPAMTDSRYWPSHKSVLNSIYQHLRAQQLIVSAPTPGTQTVFLGGDGSLASPTFKGMEKENAGEWMSRFEKYSTYRGLTIQAKL